MIVEYNNNPYLNIKRTVRFYENDNFFSFFMITNSLVLQSSFGKTLG